MLQGEQYSLFFTPHEPVSKKNLEKTNILTKFHEDQVQNRDLQF